MSERPPSLRDEDVQRLLNRIDAEDVREPLRSHIHALEWDLRDYARAFLVEMARHPFTCDGCYGQWQEAEGFTSHACDHSKPPAVMEPWQEANEIMRRHR